MDLGKVTLFSGSPQQQSRTWGSCSLQISGRYGAECFVFINFLRITLPGAALLALIWRRRTQQWRGWNSDARPTRGRPPSRPGPLSELNPPYLRLLTLSCPFLPPAPCLASPFLSTDVAKRADGTRSRGRRAVFFLSLSPFPLDYNGTFWRRHWTTRRQRRGDAHGHESPRPPRTALSQQREEISMSRRGRAASEGRGRRCNRATGNRQPGRFTRSPTSTRAYSR